LQGKSATIGQFVALPRGALQTIVANREVRVEAWMEPGTLFIKLVRIARPSRFGVSEKSLLAVFAGYSAKSLSCNACQDVYFRDCPVTQ
jgi:hypothetical protein